MPNTDSIQKLGPILQGILLLLSRFGLFQRRHGHRGTGTGLDRAPTELLRGKGFR